MSVFRSIATGYLGAKIANTEANDRLKADVLKTTGTNLLTNVIPNAIEDEKIRRQNYDMLVDEYGVNAANVMDSGGFTINKAGMDRLDELLENNQIDLKALDASVFETDYNTRYNTRVKSDQEKYNPILKQLGIDGIGSLGYNTVEALVRPETMTTEMTKDTQTDTVVEQQVPADFADMNLKSFLTPIPEPSRVESKFEKLRVNIIDQNKPYGTYSVSQTVEGGYDFNIADEYNTMYNVHNDINNIVERTNLGSGKTQSEIASISTGLIQRDIIKPANILNLATSKDGYVKTGLNTYININEISDKKDGGDMNFNIKLSEADLRNDQKAFIYNVIKSLDSSQLSTYGVSPELYGAITQSENATAFNATNPDGFKDGYTSVVLIAADRIENSYGDRASKFFLESLANFTNESGENINTVVEYRLNQIRANRLNNRL